MKVAKRMDDTITRIGLNPAQTGAPGGRSLPGMLAATVMHGAVSQVTRSIGGAVGGAAGHTIRGAGRGAAAAGKGAAGAAAAGLGGLGSILRPGSGRNTTQQSNSQQVHNRQGNAQQSAAQQNQQPGAYQNAPSPGGHSASRRRQRCRHEHSVLHNQYAGPSERRFSCPIRQEQEQFGTAWYTPGSQLCERPGYLPPRRGRTRDRLPAR
ncbi:MAG: hypothetical protein K2P26_07100 [Oscillospiraceae bacterium]|nr:hypothetical protein [Oscillospiraceae bacterium]